MTKEKIKNHPFAFTPPLSNAEIDEICSQPEEEKLNSVQKTFLDALDLIPKFFKERGIHFEPIDLFKYTIIMKQLEHRSLLKKNINDQLKTINQAINYFREKTYNISDTEKLMYESLIETLGEKKQELTKRLNMKKLSKEEMDLTNVKAYPIDSILEFNRAGFTKCLWHSDKSPSLKYYQKQNKVYCFAGCGSKDVLDCVQAIKSCTLKEAINFLKQ